MVRKKAWKIALWLWIPSIIILSLTIIVFWKNVNVFSSTMIPDNKIAFVILFIIIGILTFVSFIGCIFFPELLLLMIMYNYKYKKSLRISNEKAKSLSREYSEVRIQIFENAKLSDFISEEDVHCFAKLDKDGNIIYKIQVDIEKSTDDYVDFTNKFEI